MVNKQSFTNAAKRILHPHAGLHSPRIVHPAREWFIGLLLALTIFTVAALWSVTSYTQYKNISVEGTADDNTEVVVYREGLVNAALETFTERQAEHEQLLSTFKTTATSTEEDISETEDSNDVVDVPTGTDIEQPTEEVVVVPGAESGEDVQLEGE